MVEKRFVVVAAVVVVFMRFAKYWRVPRVEVALIRASARASVKKSLDPSVMSLVEIPSDDVASCCQPPPAYEPRSIPAAVGDEMPVPPLPAARVPVHPGVKVCVLALEVMEMVMLVSVEVARVCVTPL